MSVVIYDPATGRPLRLHQGSPRALEKVRARMAEGEACIEGDYVSIVGCTVRDGALVEAERTQDDDMRELRDRRNKLLRAHVDAMNPVRWETMDETQRQAWREYRQALLDLPETTTDPRHPVWPARPE